MILLMFFIQIFFVNIALSKEAEVVFVDIEGSSLNDTEQIKLACDLLGIRFKTYFVRKENDTEMLKSSKALYDKEALILTGRVLKYFNKDMVSLFGRRDMKTEILILGINSDIDIASLKIWSENKITNYKQSDLPRPRHRSGLSKMIRLQWNLEGWSTL